MANAALSKEDRILRQFLRQTTCHRISVPHNAYPDDVTVGIDLTHHKGGIRGLLSLHSGSGWGVQGWPVVPKGQSWDLCSDSKIEVRRRSDLEFKAHTNFS